MSILNKVKSFFDGTWRDDEYYGKLNEDAKKWYAYIQMQIDIDGREVNYFRVITMNGRDGKFPTLVKALKHVYSYVSEIPNAECKQQLSTFQLNDIAFVPTNMPFIIEIIFKKARKA